MPSQPCRVLLATDAFPPVCGGSGWSTYELARGLRARGHELTIVQPRPGTPAGMRTRSYDAFDVLEIGSAAPKVPFLRNYFKNERLYPALGRQLAVVAREHDIDVIHAQHVLTSPAAVRAGAIAHVPVVCTVRDYWPVCYWADLIHDRSSSHLCPACSSGNMLRCIRPRAGAAWPIAVPLVPYMRRNLEAKRTALAKADTVIAVSSAIARDLRARAPELAHTRVEVIPNPVDVDAIAATFATAPRPRQAPYAIFVGKLELNKGVQHLVPALASSRLPWPVIVVGDGSQCAALQQQAQSAGVDIDVLGWRPRDEALAWVAHAELVVFPSHGPESLSRVLLEAGALGVPVAAMNTGGTADIIRHEETGLLSESPGDLARDIARLAGDEALRHRLGNAARAHVKQQFDSRNVTQRVVGVYSSVIDSRERSDG